MKSRNELKKLAASDVQFKERLRRSDELVAGLNALSQLYGVLKTCEIDVERANVQRAIDEGMEECRRLSESVLQVDITPRDFGHA